MKITRFVIGNKTRYGILRGEYIQVIKGKPFRNIKLSEKYYELRDIRLLAPCEPSKIICIGLNYRNHAEETNAPLPKVPLIFLKPPSSLIGPEENIVYPKVSNRVDYEGELGVVVGKLAKRLSPEKALEYVLGYTCFNDITARDLQSIDGQWTRAKGFDTFAAVGPWIETKLESGNVDVLTFLNGKLKQIGNTNDLIYSVPELVSFVSNVMTLLPGDIIATGTPSGIGPMYPGDAVEIKIDPIGALRNYVSKDDE